jgi:hypothetical protein
MNKNDIIAKLRELGVEVDEKASVAVLKQQLAEVTGNANIDDNQADDKQDGEEKEQGNNANTNVENKDESKDKEIVEESSDGIFLIEGKYTSKYLNGKVFVNINEALRENAKAIRAVKGK